ncbi:MAG: 5-(carboxyamino)imidazole ribonucleotide mutase [Pseudobdellovibrio sp.]
MKKKISVAIIMGSQSDLKSMTAAAEALKEFKISFHIEIVSAHRTPDKMFEFAKTAADKGFEIIIAGAGGAAHLPGMVASLTRLPVIGVPVTIGNLKGLDALLSIAQMPKGVPVATMAVDNAYNAGLFAARILALSDKKLALKLLAYQKKQGTKVKKMNALLKK